jgi:hypothetical protein
MPQTQCRSRSNASHQHSSRSGEKRRKASYLLHPKSEPHCGRRKCDEVLPSGMCEDRSVKYKCPVCFYPDMRKPASSYNICRCCGTEFGNDDWGTSHAVLRKEWIAKGMPWFFRTSPEGWSPIHQLRTGAFSSVRAVHNNQDAWIAGSQLWSAPSNLGRVRTMFVGVSSPFGSSAPGYVAVASERQARAENTPESMFFPPASPVPGVQSPLNNYQAVQFIDSELQCA